MLEGPATEGLGIDDYTHPHDVQRRALAPASSGRRALVRRLAEDDPAARWTPDRLAAEMAAAADLCDMLDDAGLRITFDADPLGGRVRARVMDAAGRAASELSLAHVVNPTDLEAAMGVAR